MTLLASLPPSDLRAVEEVVRITVRRRDVLVGKAGCNCKECQLARAIDALSPELRRRLEECP